MHRNRLPSLLALLLLSALLLLLLPAPASLAQSGTDAQDIDALLDTLENGDLLTQEQAAQMLIEIGSGRAVPGLIRIYQNTDNPRPAAMALAGIGTPTALTALLNGLSDVELTPRRNAAQVAFLSLGDDAVPVLLVGLQSGQTATRRNASEVLGFIGSPRAVNNLLRVASQDADASVRQQAVWALGTIGMPRVRLTLQAISKSDPSPEVRLEALRASLRLGEMF